MKYELKRTMCVQNIHQHDDVDAHLQDMVADGWRLVAVTATDLDTTSYWEFYWEKGTV